MLAAMSAAVRARTRSAGPPTARPFRTVRPTARRARSRSALATRRPSSSACASNAAAACAPAISIASNGRWWRRMQRSGVACASIRVTIPYATSSPQRPAAIAAVSGPAAPWAERSRSSPNKSAQSVSGAIWWVKRVAMPPSPTVRTAAPSARRSVAACFSRSGQRAVELTGVTSVSDSHPILGTGRAADPGPQPRGSGGRANMLSLRREHAQQWRGPIRQANGSYEDHPNV